MGTVFGAITKRQFTSLLVIEPLGESVRRFRLLASQIDARIRAATAESRYLGTLRDSLLPKLVSGELRIPVAETATE